MITDRISVFVPIFLALAACAVDPDTDPEPLDLARAQTPDGDPVNTSLTNFCRTMTVNGKVFFNDLRAQGRFTDLRDEDGTAGAKEDYGSADDRNYHSLRDAQVDIYEADVDYGISGGCSATTHAGTTTVGSDGSFSWTGEVCETCGADRDGGHNASLAIAVKVSLRNCTAPNRRCFSVRDPEGVAGGSQREHFGTSWDGSIWSKWHTGASSTQPRQTGGTTINVQTTYFEATGNPMSPAARAANLFASLVDVTRAVHLENDVSFNKPEVAAYFPSVMGTHSHEEGHLCLGDGGAWPDGFEPMHEYGHLTHYWQWGNQGKWQSYCYNDTCENSHVQEEYAHTAFKEGWAQFIKRMTVTGYSGPQGCDDIENDDALRGCAPDALCTRSRRYTDNVEHVLCDLWDIDPVFDSDLSDCVVRDGTSRCDTKSIPLIDLVAALGAMWDHAPADARDAIRAADWTSEVEGLQTFGICDYKDELVAVDGVIENSGIDCD